MFMEIFLFKVPSSAKQTAGWGGGGMPKISDGGKYSEMQDP